MVLFPAFANRTQNRLSETNEILFNKTRLACTPHVS